MNRDIEALSGITHDVLVIGGGIFGACAAWDACLRGLSVALIEKDDFCSGTSANSYKIVHGGIRYIQHGDIIRLRSSCRERSALLKIAPHLVKPLPILIPTYGYGKTGKAFLGTGMLLYDLLTIDRNRRISDPDRVIPWSRFIGRDEALENFPDLDPDGLTGGAIFNDAQMYNPTRLVLSFIQSAAARGAVVANHVEATEFIKSGNSVTGVRAHDRINNKPLEIRARCVLNAAGPWAERLLDKSSIHTDQPKITYSRDACFVVPRKLAGEFAIAVQGRTYDPNALISRPARHLFLVPWRNYTLVGVWHVVYDESPDTVTVPQGDIESFIDEINQAYPALDLKPADVTMWNAGLVPFGENEEGEENLSYGKRSHIIDHARTDKLDNLVTLIGIRYTMARGDAEKAMNLVARKLGRKTRRPPTQVTPIYGGDIGNFEECVSSVIDRYGERVDHSVLRALVHNHGTKYPDVLAHEDKLEILGNTTTLLAEVHHAVCNEMVFSLGDLVFRRTDLATGGHPGDDVIRQCADILAGQHQWTEERKHSEISEVNSRFPDYK